MEAQQYLEDSDLKSCIKYADEFMDDVKNARINLRYCIEHNSWDITIDFDELVHIKSNLKLDDFRKVIQELYNKDTESFTLDIVS